MQKINRREFLSLSSLAVGGLMLGGCNAGGAPQTLKKVTVQLAWIHSIEYSGFYMAQAKGYYAEKGLEVTFKEFDFATSPEPNKEIIAGRAQFATIGASALMLARQAGEAVQAIATIYQRSPLALVSLAEKNIRRPQDLVGKKVMVDLKSSDSVLYTAMLAHQQSINVTEVNFIPRQDFSNDALLKGEVDVIDVFLTNQPVQLEQQGYQLNTILPSEYGVDIYANTLITSEALIASDPQLVEAFLSATLKGMAEAYDNPKEAAELTVKQRADLNFDFEFESMNRSLPLLKPSGSQVGMMEKRKWDLAYEILREGKVLSQPLEVDKVYTLAFLDKIYP